jgi:hypothetical protein
MEPHQSDKQDPDPDPDQHRIRINVMQIRNTDLYCYSRLNAVYM